MSEGGESSLGHLPGDRWEFDQEVADCFDDMLERSIPQYEVMRDAVHAVARRFCRAGSVAVDLGCARGEALARLVDEFGDACTYVGVDVSEPMLEAARRRFEGLQNVLIQRVDLREGFPAVPGASVTLAVLTLQFVPINYRQRVIRDIWERTAPGGALVLVEKVLGAGADIDGMMVDLYHDRKEAGGYSREEIDRKRLSLEGVLVPVTAEWNEDLLRRAGFREVDCFWRWMSFAAWVAVR